MFLSEIALQLIGLPIAAGLSWIGRRMTDTSRARRLWRFRSPSRLTIVLSDSGSIDTGTYVRKVTGVGQARAVGLLTPSITTAYREVPRDCVVLASQTSERSKRGDMVLVGGPKNNPMTAQFLTQLQARELPVRMETRGDEVIIWTGTDGHVEFPGEAPPPTSEGGKDFGLVLRTPEVFCPGTSVTLFAGTHTYGTIAAAEFFEHNQKFVRRLGDDFAVLVEVNVGPDGTADSPRLVRSTRFRSYQ